MGGAAVGWPRIVWAQQPERLRRIGVLTSGPENDPVVRAQLAASREVLGKLGWIEGRNVKFDVRFFAGDADRMRTHADELVRLAPDVILVSSAAATRAVQQRTRTIPIVFANVGDPVAGGLVGSFARPDGNTTGVTSLYQSVVGKWPELLKEAMPGLVRVALVFNPEIVTENYFATIESTAAALAMKAIRVPVRSADEIERAINAFAAEPNGGLIMVPPPFIYDSRRLIDRLAIQYRLPSISTGEVYAAEGDLMSYGPDVVDSWRNSSSYIDRILRGAKPGELPIQFPTKFGLAINLKTAKAIGLTIPESFLLRADALIE
jgi:putative ABC transport system substrate-binding protein